MADEPAQLSMEPPWRAVGWMIRVRDDRGVVFACRGIAERRWWHPGEMPSMELRAAGWAAFAERPGAGVLAGLGAGVLMGSFSFLPMVLFDRRSIPFWLPGLMIFVGGVSTSLLLQRLTLMRWNAERALVDARNGFLSEGRCLACGYGIAGLEAAEDGCRVCPECGAAWDAARARPTRPRLAAPGTPTPLRVLAWAVQVVDARGKRLRARWIKESWMWGARAPASLARVARARWWSVGLGVFTAVAALGMVAAMILDRTDVIRGWEGHGRRNVSLALVVGIALLRVGPVRLSWERMLDGWRRRGLEAGEPCLACGGSLAGAATVSPARVECGACKAVWSVAGDAS